MLKDRTLAFNTALLTTSGLAMRFVGMVWFQLVMSVNALAVTVAMSGSRYAVTRLVSEERGLDRPHGAAQALNDCMLYGLGFGLAAGLILMVLAEPLGFLWLEDARTVRPLMPCPSQAWTPSCMGASPPWAGCGRAWRYPWASSLSPLPSLPPCWWSVRRKTWNMP